MTQEELNRTRQILHMMEQANTMMRIGDWTFDKTTGSIAID